MIYSDPEQPVAERYFYFVNNVMGVLALSFAVASLQFKKPEPFAFIFAIIIFFWAFSEGKEYRVMASNYINRHRTALGTLVIFWKLKVFFVGYAALVLVAFGVLNVSTIYNLWPF